MTHRERLLRTLRYETVDRTPDLEFGAWEQTIDRWHKEGMPEKYKGVWEAISGYFHTDEAEYGPRPQVNIGLFPRFESKIIEEKKDHIIVQDEDGAISEQMRPELGASIPKYLQYAIETHKDWERIRDERLNPDAPGRIPQNLEELCKSTFEADYPIFLGCGSLYGWLRNWIGMERISMMFYDDPELIEEIMDHLVALTLKMFENVAGKCKIDCGTWWEDMCFNKGPLISPRIFSQFLVPRYKKITGFLRRECGCEFHILDCDGNIHELVPFWLEGGINVMFPLEVAHTDVFKIAKQFGRRIAFRGYFDKRALIAGKEAIDREFKRLKPLLRRGGFIPHTDHLVPPDVSWENYKYYRKKKKEFIKGCK